ncbi:MAG: hypothetical protein IKW21_08330 [Lachnospiraceae bacterium]|nr:hypothetical protein [Lachnospiraceae bacterium]
MNYRQLKKQYKRKYDFNPPKGYSRAKIRRGIKLPYWQNKMEVAFYNLGESFAAVAKAANTLIKSLALGPISYELRAEIERLEKVNR